MNSHYIAKMFIKNYFNEQNVFSIKSEKIIYKPIEKVFSEEGIYETSKNGTKLEADFNEKFENRFSNILKQVSDNNWNRRLTRKQALELRKWIFINYMRHPIWVQEKILTKEYWHEILFETLTIDFNSLGLQKFLEIGSIRNIYNIIFGGIMQFINTPLDFPSLTPTNLANETPYDKSIKGDKISDLNDSDTPIGIYSVLSKNRFIVITNKNFFHKLSQYSQTLYNQTLLNNKSSIRDSNILIPNVPGIDQLMHLKGNTKKYKKDNMKTTDYFAKSTSKLISKEKADLQDIFIYEYVNLNIENYWAYRIWMISNYKVEEVIFSNMKAMIQEIEFIVNTNYEVQLYIQNGMFEKVSKEKAIIHSYLSEVNTEVLKKFLELLKYYKN